MNTTGNTRTLYTVETIPTDGGNITNAYNHTTLEEALDTYHYEQSKTGHTVTLTRHTMTTERLNP